MQTTRKVLEDIVFCLDKMGEEDIVVAASAAIILVASMSKKKSRKIKNVWVKSWLAERERKGAYYNILS